MEVLPSCVRVMQRILSIVLLIPIGLVVAAQSGTAQNASLLTPWATEVTPSNVHSEYPRPTLMRSDWLNLNGHWDWKDSSERQEGFSQQILVPFPVGSALSGVTQQSERSLYRRSFTIPKDWKGEDHILLHFGAVDWEAAVFINGQQVGIHRGGYDSFSFDITPFIRRNEPNELVVQVFDPTQKGEQPRGKQSTMPSGDRYSASTGIWQTVWLEPVPPHHIQTLQIHADFSTGLVTILPILNADHKDLEVVAKAFDGKEVIAKSYGGTGNPLSMQFDKATLKMWHPDSPHRYHLQVQLRYRDTVIDEVGSYFAFRKIEIVKDSNGAPTVHLNGKRLFLMGVIDQGYFPDGLYTAPTDSARLQDIRVAKSLGFNVIRKYQKIEPERWYFWCDYLGILVWQDMPSGENKSPAAQQQFRTELQQMIQNRLHHPSIMAWTIFNEGAGQHNVAEYVDLVRRLDQTHLVNATSGWTDSKLGDFNVAHKFPGPEMPTPDANRVAIVGLFGGLTLVPPVEHLWTENTWAHQHVADSDGLLQRYKQMHVELRRLIQTERLAGAFFHQLTDIESECNGLATYNRRILKVPPETLEQINQETIKTGSR